MAQHDSQQAGREPKTAVSPDNNGSPAGTAGGTSGAGDNSSEERMRRAEELVDRMAERVGQLAGRLGHGILRLAARAREEAEDMWAEARSLSRGERP
jgi:hypothetical protein